MGDLNDVLRENESFRKEPLYDNNEWPPGMKPHYWAKLGAGIIVTLIVIIIVAVLVKLLWYVLVA